MVFIETIGPTGDLVRLLTFLLLLISAATANAQAPLEFKGIAIGSDIKDARASGRFFCRLPATDEHVVRCTRSGPSETIAGVALSSFSLTFDDDKLKHILVVFPSSQFAVVADAMVVKYGKPTVTDAYTTEELQHWANPVGTVDLGRDRDDPRSAYVALWAPDAAVLLYQRKIDRAKKAAKQNAKDL